MRESKFTGSAWGIFGWSILLGLAMNLFLIPFAFAYPAFMKWYYSKVIIDGKQAELTYEKSAWWGAIGWMLFAAVTLGFGAFYATKKMLQWNYQHLRLKDEAEA